MYATVDFKNGDKKESAVLPTIWLCNKNKKCYWPKTRNEAQFISLVKSNVPYDPKWPKYDVHKVLYTGDLETASQKLKDLIDNGSTDTAGSSQYSNVRAASAGPSEEESAPVKRKHKKHKHKSSKKSKTSKRRRKSDVRESDYDTDTNTFNSDAASKEISQSSNSLERSITGLNGDGGLVPIGSESSHTDNLMGRDTSVPSEESSGIGRDSSISQSRVRTFVLENPDSRRESPDIIPESSNPRRVIPDSKSTSSCSTQKSRGSRSESNEFRHESHDFGLGDEAFNRAATPFTPRGTVNASQNTGFGEFGISRFNISTPTSVVASVPFQEQLFRVLEGVGSMCQQNQVMLSAMSRASNKALDVAEKPGDTPPFPLESMHDFEKYDLLLRDENHSSYLTKRLAALGGSNPRKLVMNMMRFLISDVVAMEYNWVGRHSKQPFNVKNTVKCITEAVRYNFKIKEGATDTAIADTIKDWLKQAKKRKEQRKK